MFVFMQNMLLISTYTTDDMTYDQLGSICIARILSIYDESSSLL